jgi:hypothetical protein
MDDDGRELMQLICEETGPFVELISSFDEGIAFLNDSKEVEAIPSFWNAYMQAMRRLPDDRPLTDSENMILAAINEGLGFAYFGAGLRYPKFVADYHASAKECFEAAFVHYGDVLGSSSVTSERRARLNAGVSRLVYIFEYHFD